MRGICASPPLEIRARPRNGRIDDDQVGIDKIAVDVPAKAISLDGTIGNSGERLGKFVRAQQVGDRHPRPREVKKRTAPAPPPNRPSPMTVTRLPEMLIDGARCMPPFSRRPLQVCAAGVQSARDPSPTTISKPRSATMR